VLGVARLSTIPKLSPINNVKWLELKQHLALFAFAVTIPFTGRRSVLLRLVYPQLLKSFFEYSDYYIYVMGEASKVASVCLRIGELICASVVAGILGHYLYLLDQADDNLNDRIVYTVAMAGISIAFSIILMPPFKYSFWAFPLDFALFICWMVAFGLLVAVSPIPPLSTKLYAVYRLR
jgi:hypothetical protein